MTVGIFGLGYVGLTTAACLLKAGHEVVGYEISEEKRLQLANGICPLMEPGLNEELHKGVSVGSFICQEDCFSGEIPDLFFISVGTPSSSDGNTDLTAVFNVLETLEKLYVENTVKFKAEVVIRSTIPPGSLKKFSLKYPILFSKVPVVFYPEFLREGTAVSDFFSPPQTIIGALTGLPEPRQILELLGNLGFSHETVDSVTAESLKFACNSFHALKVAFGNEIGRIVNELGGDGLEVMKYFVRDTVLNISPKYLLPGAPYGGSCLPKDTRSISALARSQGLDCPILENCELSNRAQLNYIHHLIEENKPKSIAILGLAFKRDTDDVRESPSLALIDRCLKWIPGNIHVHDFLVNTKTAIGANRKFLESVIQHQKVVEFERIDSCVKDVQLVVIMQGDKRYDDFIFRSDVKVLNVAAWVLG
jgi:GDP-mannose 6-dehydrogenase